MDRAIIDSDNGVKEDTDNTTVEIENFSYSFINRDNFKEWDMKAVSAEYYRDKEIIVLNDLEFFYYTENGDVYNLEALYGEYNTETRSIRLKGDVVGVLPDNTIVKTETLFYDHANSSVSTSDTITIQRGNFFMEGKGMDIDLVEEKLKLKDKVKAIQDK